MLVNDLANRPARPARSRVLRLRGLPYRAVEDDIILFLAPLPVTRVHICRRNGRTTGEAYIQLGTRHEAGEVLRTKNRQYLGNRYIEVFEAGESDIGHPDRLQLSGQPTSSNAAQLALYTAVKVAGVVSSTSAQDIANFLEGVQLLHGLDSITFLGDFALVEVADEAAHRIALSRSQAQPSSTHLQVFPVTPAEVASLPTQTRHRDNTVVQQHASAGPVQPQYMSARPQLTPLSSLKTDGSTLKLRGLPYSASLSDVLTFFEGFHLSPADVHLESRHDRLGNAAGTGVAYVQFSNPAIAEHAKASKHKQTMGTRYIECMTWSTGATPRLPPGGLQAAEAPLGSPGWPRPFSPQSLYPPGPTYDALLPSAVFRRGADQSVGSSATAQAGGPHLAHPPASAQALSSTPRGSAGQLQGQVPFGLQQQQQQQVMLQRQYVLQQQQQQLLMQQQAMQQWGGQQWQGNMTAMGVPQGWMRPYPMRMAPAGPPLQLGAMPSRQHLQGGMGMGDPLTYGYPGPPPGYGWAPMHPANPPMMRPQAFAGSQQPPGGVTYPPARQDPLDSRMPYSPHGGRTPGRGTFRTPFSSTSQARLPHPQPQSSVMTQPLSEAGFVSQVAMSAETSADNPSSAQIMTSLEALSLTDSMSTQRLSPIVTQPALLPSSVILARTAQRPPVEGQPMPAATAAAQISPPQHQVQVSDSAGLPDTAPVTISEMSSDPVAAAAHTVSGNAFGSSA